MTTQTDDSTDLLPSLDACPKCIDCDKAADYWLKAHNCHGGLFCETCKRECLDFINDCLAEDGEVECRRCYRRFSSIRDALTVIPL